VECAGRVDRGAEASKRVEVSFWGQIIQHLVAALVFSVFGVGMLGGCYWLMTIYFPFSVVKEIEQDQNTALGIIIGSVLIGMSIIIAAAIYGLAP
jgi:putative membrane protein